MVRRTKAEAAATRSAILDAAELQFQAHGVSRVSLQQIAAAAGVTRGAVYHHFADKAALFDAMMARVEFPMEQALHALDAHPGADPLGELRALLIGNLQRLASDERTQRVFEIAMHKVETVDELSPIRSRHRQAVAQHIQSIERCLQRAGLPTRHALALHALFVGLMETWMLDRSAFDLMSVGTDAVERMLAALHGEA